MDLAGSLTIEAKTGRVRSYVGQAMTYEAGTYVVQQAGRWTDTTTNITSRDIVSNTTNAISSGVISLYRLKR